MTGTERKVQDENSHFLFGSFVLFEDCEQSHFFSQIDGRVLKADKEISRGFVKMRLYELKV